MILKTLSLCLSDQLRDIRIAVLLVHLAVNKSIVENINCKNKDMATRHLITMYWNKLLQVEMLVHISDFYWITFETKLIEYENKWFSCDF